MSWEWFSEKEIYTQLVYDTKYNGTCPVCKIEVVSYIHYVEEKSGKIYISPDKNLSECHGCHVALYLPKINTITTRQTYVTDKEHPLGLKKIKEEVI